MSWPPELPVVRVRWARPTDRLDEVVAFYTDGLGLQELGRFEGHAGYDGVLVGLPGSDYHLEFTRHVAGSPARRRATTTCSSSTSSRSTRQSSWQRGSRPSATPRSSRRTPTGTAAASRSPIPTAGASCSTGGSPRTDRRYSLRSPARRDLQSTTTRGQICASRPRRGSARGDRARLPPHRVAQARDEPDPADAGDEALLARLPLRHEQGADRLPAREARRGQRLDRRHVRAATCGSSSSSGRRAGRVAFLWNGRDDDGRRRARRLLPRACAPRPDREDVPPPEPDPRRHEGAESRRSSPSRPRVFSPDGDRRADRIAVRYTVDERARGMLYVDGIRLVVGASLKPAGELRWYGKVDGRSLPARRYALAVAAVDLAGNHSAPVDAGHVRIRYVELASSRLRGEGRRRRSRPSSRRDAAPGARGGSASGSGIGRAPGLPRPRPEDAGALHPRRLRPRPPGRRRRRRGAAVTRRRWILVALALALAARGRRGRRRLVVPRADDGRRRSSARRRSSSSRATKPQAKPRPPKVVETIPWPTYGYDNQRTHLSPFSHRPPYRRLWMLRARWYVEFPPVGRLREGLRQPAEGRLLRRRREDGQVALAAEVPLLLGRLARRVARRPRRSCRSSRRPARAARAACPGVVIAMREKDGRTVWRAPIASESSPLVVGGRVYVGSWDHRLYALGLGTRKLLWSTQRRRRDRQLGGVFRRDGLHRRQQRHRDGARRARRAPSAGRRGRSRGFLRGREYFYATPTVAYGRVFASQHGRHASTPSAPRTGNLLWATPRGHVRLHGAGGVEPDGLRRRPTTAGSTRSTRPRARRAGCARCRRRSTAPRP